MTVFTIGVRHPALVLVVDKRKLQCVCKGEGSFGNNCTPEKENESLKDQEWKIDG